MPIATRDRLDNVVSHMDKQKRSDVLAGIAAGKPDGTGVLVDALNQVLINAKGQFGGASPAMTTELRNIATGLQPGQSSETQTAAIRNPQDLLSRRDPSEQLGHLIDAVQMNKLANLNEWARILENEAGSPTDQPIMEAVGHTVLNRMQRNETEKLSDVSKGYARGNNPAQPQTRVLAIQLLNGALPDPTGGATHFYQPAQMKPLMAVPQNARGQYQTDLPPQNYEYIPGVTLKLPDKKSAPAFSVAPPWAKDFSQTKVTGIPDSLAIFLIAPGSRHVR
jgi:hypothetical protein